MMAYMTVKGQKQGMFAGGITQKGREGKIGVIAVDHSVLMPHDAASGLATGRKMSRPFKVTVELDKATPLFYNAMASNENLSEVTLEFWTPQIKAASRLGCEVQHYTVKLTNASISEIHFNMANIRVPELEKMPQTLEISFTYQKIEYLWKDGGINATDNWSN